MWSSSVRDRFALFRSALAISAPCGSDTLTSDTFTCAHKKIGKTHLKAEGWLGKCPVAVLVDLVKPFDMSEAVAPLSK